MIEKLGTSILENTQHILSFIAHALEPAPSLRPEAQNIDVPSLHGWRFGGLRIVDNSDDDEYNAPAPENGDYGSQDLTFTAVNLLLAVLEGA